MNINRLPQRPQRYLFFVFLFCLLLSSILFWWHRFPSDEIGSDSAQYHGAAVSLLENGSYGLDGKLTMLREPGYPFFLFLTYELFGPNPDAAKIVQFFLLFGIILGIYFLAKNLFNGTIARAVAVLMAVYPIYSIFTGLIYSEILATFLVILFLCIFYSALKRESNLLFVAAGSVLGCFVMVKSAFVFLSLLIPALIFYFFKPSGWRVGLRRAAIFIIGFSIIVAPWMCRNYYHFHRFSIASRGGLLFYIRSVKTTYDHDEIGKYIIASVSGNYIVQRYIDADYNFEQDGQGLTYLRKLKKDRITEVDSNNYDVVDPLLAAEADRFIGEHPIKFFLYGLIEVNNLNSPIIYYDRHFNIFYGDIYSRTAVKTTAIILLRIGWYLFLFFVFWAMRQIVKNRNMAAYALLLFILDINLTIFFLQGLPRTLMPVLPIYFMLALAGLQYFINKALGRFDNMKAAVRIK